MNVADQIRALGLKVGDTIEGTEHATTWWNTTRLTLLWVGEAEAAWSAVYKSSDASYWSLPRESTNWDLRWREWRKIDPSNDTPHTQQ